MANTATVGTLRAVLTAETGQFTSAMATAIGDTKKLSDALGKDLEPRQRAVNAAVKDFLGGNEIRKAQEYIEAVKQIGGAANLVESDQRKVNSAVSEALGHYQKLGKAAPADMLALRDATAEVEKPISALDGVLGFLGPKVVAAFSIGAVSAFIGSLIDSVSHIQDVASKMDVGVEAAQRWEYAVNLSGGTIDQVSKSVINMSKALAEGGSSVVGALKSAGVEFDTIRAMKPEDAFDAIALAIKNVPDPMDQARIATELFGKAGVELLPAIRAGMVELGQQAPIMKKETVEAIDAMGDAWTWLKTTVKTQVAEMIGGPIAEWKRVIGALSGETEEGARKAMVASIPTPELFERVIPKIGATGDALEDMMEQSQKLNKETQTSVDKWEAHNKAIQDAAEIFTGKHLAKEVKDLADALALANTKGGPTDYQFQQIAKHARELREQGGKLTGELADMAEGLDILDYSQRKVKGSAEPIPKALDAITRAALGAAPPTHDLAVKVGGVHEAMKQISGTFYDYSNLEPPAEVAGAWDEVRSHAKQVLDDIEGDVADSVVGLIGHWSHWRSKSKEIWDEIKSGISTVLADILKEIETKFITRLVAAFTMGGQSASAGLVDTLARGAATAGTVGGTAAVDSLNTVLAANAPAVGTATGSAAGETFAAGFAGVATAGIYAYIGYKLADSLLSWIGDGKAPRGSNGWTPVPGSPVSGPEARFEYGGITYDQSGAYAGPDPGQPGPGGEFGGDNGQPQYGSFPSYSAMAAGGVVYPRPGGTIVRLAEAGYPEAVIPIKSGGGAWGDQTTTIVLEQDGRRSAEFVVPHIPGVMQRLRLV